MDDRYLRPDSDYEDVPFIPAQSRYPLLWSALRVGVILVAAALLIWFLMI